MLVSAEIRDGLRRRLYSARLAVAAPAVRLGFGLRRAVPWPGLGRRSGPWPGLGWRSGGRRRLMIVVGALAGLSFGTGVTLAIAGTPPSGLVAAGPAASSANRAAAAAWITGQLAPGITVSCDPQMCAQVRQAGLPAARLLVVPPSAGILPGAGVVLATPVVRDQFGVRLAAADAPLVLASFGSGAGRVDVRAVAPGGAAAFDASLAAGHARLISAGEQLLANTNISASAAARGTLLAGQVDPRLLVTLSALAADVPLRLVAFDDSSPGASPAVPLRGAEFGAVSPAGLAAVLEFLRAQQAPYRPAAAAVTRGTGGQSLVTIEFDAQDLAGLGGI